MLTYLPCPPCYEDGDYEDIRRNGMWYERGQAGYADLVKAGHPEPPDEFTILAALYSPQTDDFLHGHGGGMPFLVSDRARRAFERACLTGWEFTRVEVAKIATKGRRQGKSRGGEPEDVIWRAKNVRDQVQAPVLHAIRATGRVEIVAQYPTGRCPGSSYVTPFDLPADRSHFPDLWRPTIAGETFAAWTYCSERFRQVTMDAGLTNIAFTPFEEMMASHRSHVLA